MNFKQFSDSVNQRMSILAKTGKLFRSSVTGSDLWTLYITSFKPGDDPVFRDPNSTEHNCNLDKSFIRRYGNIVAIDENYQIITLWDIDVPEDSIYYSSAKAMSEYLKLHPISDIFVETLAELQMLQYEKINKNSSVFRLGTENNHKIYTPGETEQFGVVKSGEVYTFNHFYCDLPTEFVDKTGKSQAEIIAGYRDANNVFKRGLEEISMDTLMLVKDLIVQGSLLDGTAHLYKIEALIPLKATYNLTTQKDNWCWVTSYNLQFAKFRNELIGTLCVELSEGVELNKAVLTWNKRVDPANYMKAVAPITSRQIEEAKKFVQEKGFEESFNRRFATIEDINVNQILHSNVGNGNIKTASLFDNVKPATSTRHKRSEFDKVEEVSIDKFMTDILPGCTSVEIFVENKLQGNFVALTTAADTSKPIFKWDNPFSWTFNGNLAGKSQIKEAVKDRGGNVDGVMRISLAFPDTTDDYDLHLIEPNQNHIYFSNVRQIQKSSGRLDLDAQGRDGHQIPEKRVENIIYTDITAMPKGNYVVSVNNYSQRGLHTPFTLEIEIEGEITTLRLTNKTSNNKIDVATINFDGHNFKITESKHMSVISSNTITKKIWNVDTGQFHKVNLVCTSPNHWGDNNVGNKHYMFMLEDCKADTPIRSFHNENLNGELLEHRKVMEVLGATNMLPPAEKQLAGLGFNSTVKDEVVLKLSGSHKRAVKIKFGS